MNKKLLDEMRVRVVMQVDALVPAQRCGLAITSSVENQNLFVECTHTVKLSVKLSIRHGAALHLRNVLWQVSNSEMEILLLGRHILRALGLDPNKLLKAVFEKCGSEIDGNDLVPEKTYKSGTLAYVMNQGVFHSKGYEKYTDINDLDEECFVDLGNDTPEELDYALHNILHVAKGMGTYCAAQANKCQYAIQRCISHSPWKLSSRKVEPMHIQLNPSVTPIIAKKRLYSEQQRKFRDAYFDRFLELGFVVREQIRHGQPHRY